MCGIFGLLAREVDHERVERALGTLADRGPDGHRIWRSEDDRVALGHAHLSIVGKGDNAQPLRNERGTIVASVNGEFYGYETIRRELEKGGHRFSTRSDSEIVVHLYEEYGVECLAHLRGEFAIVLWDANNGTVFAARDRFGVKPLVWSVHHGDVIVSSRARAILEYTDHRNAGCDKRIHDLRSRQHAIGRFRCQRVCD